MGGPCSDFSPFEHQKAGAPIRRIENTDHDGVLAASALFNVMGTEEFLVPAVWLPVVKKWASGLSSAAGADASDNAASSSP